MKVNEFYKRYSNLPLSKRNMVIDFGTLGMTTMAGLYKQIDDLEQKLRPLNIEQQNNLTLAKNALDSLLALNIKQEPK